MRAFATAGTILAISAITASATALPASSRPTAATQSASSPTYQLKRTASLDTAPRDLRVTDATRVRFDVGTSRVRLYVRWEF